MVEHIKYYKLNTKLKIQLKGLKKIKEREKMNYLDKLVDISLILCAVNNKVQQRHCTTREN